MGVFGLEGTLKCDPLSAFGERYEPGAIVLVDGTERRILASHAHKGQVRLKLQGIDTVEAAEAMRGKKLYVPGTARPQLDEDEFYARDLVGMSVVTEDGERLGQVRQVVAKPAQDLLEVGDLLIPFVRTFVVSVSMADRRIVVRLIPGMRGEADEA